MGHELKTETLAERSHLGHRRHLAPGAAQHHHMRVIDHDAGRAAREVPQRLGEKHLAVKTLEARVALKEQHPRITQHGRRGLHLALFATQSDFVRRGVMLQLLARGELVTAGSHHRRLPDPVAAAEGGQRLVGQLRAAGHQLLMDPDQIPLALVHQLEDLLPVGLGLLPTIEFGHLRRTGAQHPAHR